MFEEREPFYVLGENIGFHLALVLFLSVAYYLNGKFGIVGLPVGYVGIILVALAASIVYRVARRVLR